MKNGVNSLNNTTKLWYESSYNNKGFQAQRLYPNEELLRFMGRNFFKIDLNARNKIHILEVGCGSCSNLWMIANEGFNAYGLDLSESSIELGRKMLKRWNVNACLENCDMTKLPYEDSLFNAIVDVFSTYCLSNSDFVRFLNESYRTLKTSGKLFLYTPSINSDAFKMHSPSVLIEDNILNGIYREDSPFYGNFYPFRFESKENLSNLINNIGFEIDYIETTTKSYNSGTELFEHIILECTKK